MAIDEEQLVRFTPFLFHLTYEQSLDRIRRLNALESASHLLELASRTDKLRDKRDEPLPLVIDDDSVLLTDQTPLNENNIKFEDGWTLGDLVEAINRRVFFWRGKENGLLSADRGQFDRYSKQGTSLVFLRIPFADAIATNSQIEPSYCKYNSGGARQHPETGRIPRGPSTFVTAQQASFTVKDIREVTFLNRFELPESTLICHGGYAGPWVPLKDCNL